MILTLKISIFFSLVVFAGTILYLKKTKTKASWKNLGGWSAAAFVAVWLVYFFTEVLPDLGSE